MIKFLFQIHLDHEHTRITQEQQTQNIQSQEQNNRNCCEILKYSQVYEPYRSIVGQERGRTHRDLNERRKIKSNLNKINPNLV